MKKILIISPHFPPSNLAAVHRSRLFAKHLPAFEWEPIILTVDEKYYEETPDHNLSLLLSPTLRIEKTSAFKITVPRLIGDIGLRSFFQLFKKARQIILTEKINFLYIPIPSFYVALLGRLLHRSTGIKYGIDYIDPWVHNFPGSDKLFSRHWISTKIARILEPIAIKNASLITGVADGYYQGVFERNPKLKNRVQFGSMPYGGEIADHKIIGSLGLKPYLFEKKPGKLILVYAGAMLPKAYLPLEIVCKEISRNIQIFKDVEFHFIGTGKTANDPFGFNIKALAEKYNLWQNQIFEYPQRIPYLDVLIHLEAADGVFILGSTEPHYTPSKVYQGVMAEKYLFAILHKNSSAASVIRNSKAGIVLDFNGVSDTYTIKENFITLFSEYINELRYFDPAQVDKNAFEKYSAFSVTEKLVNLINNIS